MKNSFLKNEFWLFSVQGAFQRANCYKSSGVTEQEKSKFRDTLKVFVDVNVLPMYQKEVSEEQHIQNIYNLIEESKKHSAILKNGAINIGISQKLLNLYLKYNWCAGFITTPPHFPVDRTIQDKLRVKPVILWTRTTEIKDYMSVINCGKNYLQNNSQYISLAEMELSLFNRR